MLTFNDVKTYIAANLTTLYPADYTNLVIEPGPSTALRKQKKSAQRMLFLLVGGGAGYTTEQVYDQPFIVVRAVGNQRDYTDAEKLAQRVDKLLRAIGSPAMMDTTRVLFVNRTGAGPVLVDLDDGDRYHFQCTYITESQTGN